MNETNAALIDINMKRSQSMTLIQTNKQQVMGNETIIESYQKQIKDSENSLESYPKDILNSRGIQFESTPFYKDVMAKIEEYNTEIAKREQTNARLNAEIIQEENKIKQLDTEYNKIIEQM